MSRTMGPGGAVPPLYPLEESSTNNDVFASAQLTRRPGSLLAAAAAAAKKEIHTVRTCVYFGIHDGTAAAADEPSAGMPGSIL